jgi:uncharacterized LabA/DUF88 family protein
MVVFNAYIDGFNLYKGALVNRNHLKWLDLPSFCQSRRPDMELGDIYYFTARIKARFTGDTAPNRQHAYLRVLAHQGVKIVEGQFRKDRDWLRLVTTNRQSAIQPTLASAFGLTQRLLDSSAARALPDLPKSHVWSYGEKGSDVNLASYLLRDVYSKDLSAALVVSGDSDLSTPILLAREHGADIKTLVPNKAQPCERLREVSSFLEQLHVSDLKDHQLSRVFKTPKGGTILRPEPWT